MTRRTAIVSICDGCEQFRAVSLDDATNAVLCKHCAKLAHRLGDYRLDLLQSVAQDTMAAFDAE